MSIYGTEGEFHLVNEDHRDGRPVEIMVQVVPSWVDFEADYLPPPRKGIPEGDGYVHPRAAFFVEPGSGKGGGRYGGQEYHKPLLVLSGEEYERMPFREVMERLQEAISKPRRRWKNEHARKRPQRSKTR